MVSQNPEDRVAIETIKLFESAHGGFGDATEVTNYRYNRVHGSIDARWPGQVRAGLQIKSIANANWDGVPVFATEWTDKQGINPQIYIFVNDEVWGLRFGTLAEGKKASDGATDQLGATATTGMFHDNGSGVPLLYAGFGDTGSENDIRSLTRFNPGAVDSNGVITADADATLRADLLFSHNGKAYRSFQPTGGSSTCAVSVLGIGSNPLTASAWGAQYIIGHAGTDITGITAVRHNVIAIKPEGMFMFNEGLDRWVNQIPGWDRFYHNLTGINALALGNQAVVPLGDGGAILFDGYNVKPFDPAGLEATPNVHTTTSHIDAFGTQKYWIVGATKCDAKEISAGTSLRVWHYDLDTTTYTDNSANMRDGDLTSGSRASWIISQSADYVYIGWDRPFVEAAIDLLTPQTNNVTVTAAVGTTAGDPGSYTSVSVRDFTLANGGTDSLGQSGKIVMTEDPVAVKNWIKTTVNGVERYWLRLNWSGAFSGTVVVLQIRIQPWHPSVDDANFPLDGLDKSGNFPHIIMGTKDRQKNIWHDVGSLPEPDDIGAVLYANVGGTNLNRYRNLLLIGRFRIWRADVTATDHPGTEEAPFINDKGLIEASSFVPGAGTEQRPGSKLSRLLKVRIMGEEADPALLGRFYYTWDYGKSWNKCGAVEKFPAVFEFNQPQRGYRFHWAWGWSQSSDTALLTQPALTEIEADFEILEDELDTVQERSLATTPRF